MKEGMVSLVGAGCGDPEFLTLKAQKRLQSCEVLVYDSLVSERIIAQAPIECEKIYVGKRYGRHAMRQEEINALLVSKAQEGKRVVRLKGGDPYVFGRGGEEFLAVLDAGIFCEEIPGITSCVAVPAAVGIPVTHRGMSRSFTVITGTTAQGEGQEGLQMDFEVLARFDGTLVILMGMHHLEEIAEGLLKAGKAPGTPCAVIMEGTTKGQRCVRAPLSEIAVRAEQAQMKPPAVIVIGTVAQLELVPESGERTGGRESGRFDGCLEADAAPERAGARLEADAAWESAGACPAAEQALRFLPLDKIAVGVTGTPHFVGKLSGILREKGASVRDMGFMEIRENPALLPDLGQYSWLVFTSPNGVRIFLEKIKKEKRDLRRLWGNKIAVIGPGTAQALEEAGIYPDYMPQRYDVAHLAEGLAERILAEGNQVRNCPAGKDTEGSAADGMPAVTAKPALFLRASEGSRALPQIFEEKGLSFIEFPLYEIGVDEERREQAMAETPDYVVFGSGSGVRAYFAGRKRAVDKAGLGELILEAEVSMGKHPRYVCMGEACGRELARFTEENFLAAQESSMEGIAACICSDIEGQETGRSR